MIQKLKLAQTIYLYVLGLHFPRNQRTDHDPQIGYLLHANRYDERKDLLYTIKGFALAKSEFKRESKLVMHTPNIHSMHQKIVEDAIEDLNIGDDIMINPMGNAYVNNDQLNDPYNLCDIAVNTSLEEGWGLISFEHALCGKAQIVPGHTSPGEHWRCVAETAETKEVVAIDD